MTLQHGSFLANLVCQKGAEGTHTHTYVMSHFWNKCELENASKSNLIQYRCLGVRGDGKQCELSHAHTIANNRLKSHE